MATEWPDRDDASFDEVTLEKLDIFTRYLSEWLPGSRSGHRQVIFNDTDTACVKYIARKLGPRIRTEDGRAHAAIQYSTAPFDRLLLSQLPKLKRNRTANLLFVSRAGVSELSEKLFTELHDLKHTDLLFFVSSTWFQQFTDTDEAEHWAMEPHDIEAINYNHIHRFITSYFRNLVGNKCYVAPFSLKLRSKIHSLTLVTHNPVRLEKFLRVAWHRDPYTAESNFNLYDDRTSRRRLALVGANKILNFQKELMACLESGKFRSDRDIYLHTLQRGFLGRHAAETVRAFCSRRNVQFRTRIGSLAKPRLSKSCFYTPRPIVYN